MEFEKKCFIISPIGKDGSNERLLADKVKLFLKREIFNELSYKCIRADEINQVGIITNDVIAKLISSDMVIALLDYENVNVYYELAVRHATGKICISIISREYLNTKNIPFDINQERLFKFPLQEMLDYNPGNDLSKDMAKFKNLIIESTELYENEEYKIFNPITAAKGKIILPNQMTMHDVITHIDDKFDSLNSYLKDWLPDDVRTAVQEMYDNGCATYITGEDAAFNKLTEVTKQAKHSVRTSRFAPQAISNSHKDFFSALCDFGKRENVECYRIMCMNNKDKIHDIWETVFNTCGGSMKLYLTNRDNNFELVVIDNLAAFLHFYDENRIIKSTLYIRGQVVVHEFEKIYDRFLDKENDDSLIEINCNEYDSPETFTPAITEILKKFDLS